MARIYDFSLADIQNRGANILANWPKISMEIAPKLRHTKMADLIHFGKVLASARGRINQALLQVQSGAIENSLGSGLFGKNQAGMNIHQKRVANMVLSPQVLVQMATHTLSIHERKDHHRGYYLALVLHKPFGRKDEILTSKDPIKHRS